MAFHSAGAQRRVVDASLRCVNDHPRKKRKRAEEEAERRKAVERKLETKSLAERVVDYSRPREAFIVRLLSRWIRNPFCRRVAAAQFTRLTAPDEPLAHPSFPHLKRRYFVDFETLKDFVVGGDAADVAESRLNVLAQGAKLAWTRSSVGEAVEIGVVEESEEEKDEEARAPPRVSADDAASAASSFDIIRESFGSLSDLYEENIFPSVHPDINPFDLKIPFSPSPVGVSVAGGFPLVEGSASFERMSKGEDESRGDDELCGESENDRRSAKSLSALEWRSEKTDDMEIDLSSRFSSHQSSFSLRVSRWVRRAMINLREGKTSTRRRPPKTQFCALPLDRLAGDAVGRRKKIFELALVEELIEEPKRFSSGALAGHPFVCEGRIVSLREGAATEPSGAGRIVPREFVVTPKFDLTLEEFLLQTGDAGADLRVSMFLQSLEAVANLHANGIAHGAISPSSFFVDLNGGEGRHHRLLLSNFKEISPSTKVAVDKDSWDLGRLALQLFDNDVEDELEDQHGSSLLDLPVLQGGAPLEMDILVHLLMRNPSSRVSPSVAANMLQLYFWRQEFYSPESLIKSRASSTRAAATRASAPTNAALALKTDAFEEAKRNAWRSLGRPRRDGAWRGDAVAADLRRSFFRRAELADLAHADRMWKESRNELENFSVSRDVGDLPLFVEE